MTTRKGRTPRSAPTPPAPPLETQAPAPEEAAAPVLKKAAAKKAGNRKIHVRAAKGYAISYPAQNVRIATNAISEVLEDRWIRRQIELGSLIEV